MRLVRIIISGGREGACRAALDVATVAYMKYGGHCPIRREADGAAIPHEFSELIELQSLTSYLDACLFNMLDSDGTVIFGYTPGPSSNFLNTIAVEARKAGKPVIYLDMKLRDMRHAFPALIIWLKRNKITRLNVVGPSEAEAPGISADVFSVLRRTMRMREWRHTPRPRTKAQNHALRLV